MLRAATGNGGSGECGGKNGVGGGSSTGRDKTYDADGDRHRRRCPRGAARDVKVMITMAGERGGKATARRRRGDGEATAR